MDDEESVPDAGQAKARREYLARTLQSMTSVPETLEEAIVGLQKMGALPTSTDMPELKREIMLAASEILGRPSKAEDFQGSSLEELLAQAKRP